MGEASGWPFFRHDWVRISRITCWELAFFYNLLPIQDKLSACSAAVATDVHVAVISTLLVAATSAVLALATCDLGVEQRQLHL